MRGPRTVARASRETGIPEDTILHLARLRVIGQPVGDRCYVFSWEDVLWLKEHVQIVKPNPRNKEWLTTQLLHRSIKQIAEESGMTDSGIRYWCNKFGIPMQKERQDDNAKSGATSDTRQ